MQPAPAVPASAPRAAPARARGFAAARARGFAAARTRGFAATRARSFDPFAAAAGVGAGAQRSHLHGPERFPLKTLKGRGVALVGPW